MPSSTYETFSNIYIFFQMLPTINSMTLGQQELLCHPPPRPPKEMAVA